MVERSTGLMTDVPTMSPVCLHNSCFGGNIIKGLETFFFFNFPPLLTSSQETGSKPRKSCILRAYRAKFLPGGDGCLGACLLLLSQFLKTRVFP